MAAALGIAGCGVSHSVRPLGRGGSAVRASLGGPLVAAKGTPVPAPILLVGGGYGLGDRLDATADADVTAAAYGVAHLAPGVVYHLRAPVARSLAPAVSLGASVHLLTNIADTRVAPQLSAVAAWALPGGHLIYGGGDAGVVFGDPTRMLAGPLLGGEVRLGERYALAVEIKWLAPYYDVRPTAPDWISPGGRGYFSTMIGLRRALGTPAEGAP